jgi:hypothetical protein
MTEMQPTEIELTGKKDRHAPSKRRIAAYSFAALMIALIIALVILLARQATITPESINPEDLSADRTEQK